MNRPPATTEVCVYCGSSDRLTRDHVPPGNMFPTPRPADLITVPACSPCNVGFSKDDEYFRLATLGPIALRDERARQLWDSVARGLRRSITERQARFAIEFHDSWKEIEDRDEQGRVVGTVPARRIYVERLDKTLARITGALIWHEYGQRTVPGTVRFAQLDMGFIRKAGPGAFLNGVGIDAASRRTAAGGLFEYWHRTYGDPQRSDWFFAFYGILGFLVRAIQTSDDPS